MNLSPCVFQIKDRTNQIELAETITAATPEEIGQCCGRLYDTGNALRPAAYDRSKNGVFSAINVDSGKVVWQYKAKQPLIGGALVTAGNLVFMGEGNGYFTAFDARSGTRLWQFNLGAGVNAPPITYSVKGIQYVAIAAGGNFQMGFPMVTRSRYSDYLRSNEAVLRDSQINDAYALLDKTPGCPQRDRRPRN
jgi:outer membrane protein assembly factor BamB